MTRLFFTFLVLAGMDYSRKKPNKGGWGHGISRGIEERKCGNSRGQLKKKRNFEGCSSKNSYGLVFDLGTSKGCHTILLNFHGWKLVFSRISKGKVTNLKCPGGFSGFFFWNSPIQALILVFPTISQLASYKQLCRVWFSCFTFLDLWQMVTAFMVLYS